MNTKERIERNKTEAVLNIVAQDKVLSNEVDEILCPICLFNFTHISSARIDESDDYTAWSGRGSVAVIKMWGECGHSWELCVGFHKGNCKLFIRSAGEDQQDIQREDQE